MHNIIIQIAQAITDDGGISAEWVLVGVTFVLGCTITFMFKILKSFLEQTLSSMKETITEIRKENKLHAIHLEEHDREIFTVQRDLSNYKKEREAQSKEIKEINKTTLEILLKLRAATPE